MTCELSLNRRKAKECLTIVERGWIPETLQEKPFGLDRSQRMQENTEGLGHRHKFRPILILSSFGDLRE